MTRRLRAVRKDESGAMLIVALIIITSIAVVTGALLTQGGSSFRATAVLKGVAGTSYSGDTAAKVAINNLRLGAKAPGWVAPTFPGPWTDWVYTNNADGAGCFGADGTAPDNSLELNNIYPKAGDQTAATSARVECTVVPGTGIFSGVGVDPTDAYAQALTTVGTTGALQGMILKPLGTGNQAAMPVRGGIASKSFITVDNGALVTDGSVRAEGACTGVIVSNPAKVCNAPAGSVSVPPAPQPLLASLPSYRNPADYAKPNCTFKSGYYNDAKALNAAVNGCTVANFESGVYYFDFNDERHGGTNAWHIDTTVIGGESTGNGIPGACKSPIFNSPVTGVQFVFGGNSQITVSDTAHVELCGPSNGGGDPPVTIYQQKDSVGGASQVALSARPASVVDQLNGQNIKRFVVEGPGSNSQQVALSGVGGTYLSWTATQDSHTAAIDLTSFSGVKDIPVGSDIIAADLTVHYAKSASAGDFTVDVTGSPNASAVTIDAPGDAGSASVSLVDHLRELFSSSTGPGTQGPKVELRLAPSPANQTLTVDAVTLAVTYVGPGLRAAEDVKLVYAPGGNFHGEFVVQGATYAPKGFIDLDPGSFDTALVAFRWGLLASGVNLKAQPSQQFGYPLVSVPVPGTGLGNRVTVVDLEVYVCVEQGTCPKADPNERHALTVRVMITDPPYSAFDDVYRPEPGRRKVDVLSWSAQR